MNELSNQNNELQLMNTPLQNLRNILSDVDATAQSVPKNSKTAEKILCLQESDAYEVSKSNVKGFIEKLAADSKQFFSPETLNNALNELRPATKDATIKASGTFFENIHVTELDRLLKTL